MTTKTNLMVLMAIVAIGITGMSTVYAVSNTGPFSPSSPDQHGGTCGTNFTNNLDYSCAVAYSTGYMYPLAKVYGGVGNTEWSEIRLNAEQIGTYSVGSSPEFTTSAGTVTFTSQWDIEGVIYKPNPTQQITYLFYGHEMYKKNASGGWDEVGTECREAKYASFNNVETVSCSISNSGTNTYRIGAHVEAKAQNNSGAADITYADFYTGNNHVQLTSLSIT